jgi:DNA-binding PadR family transcriptional regulator
MSLLCERPMHPYEMKMHMQERGHNQVIKLTGGSLYDTVERLDKLGFIAMYETSREGRRPERTTYTITDAGRDELRLWLQELIGDPVHEYPAYGAALAFILVLPEAEAVHLLEHRVARLESLLAADDAMLRAIAKSGLPRLVAIEGEYARAVRKAELTFTRGIVRDLHTGKLKWPTLEDFAAAGYEPHASQLETGSTSGRKKDR